MLQSSRSKGCRQSRWAVATGRAIAATRKQSEFEAISWLEMALRRVFVDVIEGGAAVARGTQAHHLARVARLQAGEQVEVSDQVTAYRALTESCTPAEVRFRIEGALPAEPEFPRLSVVLAIVKFARFEWAVEKLTELGVHSITPLIAARSDAKLVQSAEKRAERWRRIALEAAQQSRRLAAPTVAGADGLRGRCPRLWQRHEAIGRTGWPVPWQASAAATRRPSLSARRAVGRSKSRSWRTRAASRPRASDATY